MSEDQKTARDLELEAKQKEADATNKERGNKLGTRVRVGQTRGKSPVVINWEAFDQSIPESMPKSIQQFMEVTTVKDEPTLVEYLIEGYNSAQYTAASDPLAEYVNAAWPADAQAQFRVAVRNYSRGVQVSIEDAVSLIKPGFDKQFGA